MFTYILSIDIVIPKHFSRLIAPYNRLFANFLRLEKRIIKKLAVDHLNCHDNLISAIFIYIKHFPDLELLNYATKLC